ncbi:MAG: hypothetical protein ACYCYI_05245 [Saccharofermentanales bacterium]
MAGDFPFVDNLSGMNFRRESYMTEPPIKTRLYWIWDHCAEWALNRSGAQSLGASNHYTRGNEAFIDDFTRILEWCGNHNIDGICVAGLLRDSHGGMESVKKLCEVAVKNNVRLMPILGLNSYGGVYYEGDSPYNLGRHLEKNPDLYGMDPYGNKMVYSLGWHSPVPSPHACPSRSENQEYTAESLQWLFKTFPDLGGLQMETGDTGICSCKLCKERRLHEETDLSYQDMELMYPIAAEAIRSVSKDKWIICETYQHPMPSPDPDVVGVFGGGRPAWSDRCIENFPEDSFVQWYTDPNRIPSLSSEWTEAGDITLRDKKHKHVMRSAFSNFWGGLRGEIAVDGMAELVSQNIAHGIDTISIWGEVSPFYAGTELNYLAHENFGSVENPGASLDVFLKEVAGPLLGGEDYARDYLRYARLYKTDQKTIAAALPDIYARCGKLPVDAAKRWAWLAGFLSSTVY